MTHLIYSCCRVCLWLNFISKNKTVCQTHTMSKHNSIYTGIHVRRAAAVAQTSTTHIARENYCGCCLLHINNFVFLVLLLLRLLIFISAESPNSANVECMSACVRVFAYFDVYLNGIHTEYQKYFMLIKHNPIR